MGVDPCTRSVRPNGNVLGGCLVQGRRDRLPDAFSCLFFGDFSTRTDPALRLVHCFEEDRFAVVALQAYYWGGHDSAIAFRVVVGTVSHEGERGFRAKVYPGAAIVFAMFNAGAIFCCFVVSWCDVVYVNCAGESLELVEVFFPIRCVGEVVHGILVVGRNQCLLYVLGFAAWFLCFRHVIFVDWVTAVDFAGVCASARGAG